jgi:hypothetical protein
VHLLDLESGELTPVRQNDEGFIGFLADDSLTLRWALAQNAAGGMDMFEITDGKVAATPRSPATPPTARRCTGSTAAAGTPPR